jgi:hypothetical protein
METGRVVERLRFFRFAMSFSHCRGHESPILKKRGSRPTAVATRLCCAVKNLLYVKILS